MAYRAFKRVLLFETRYSRIFRPINRGYYVNIGSFGDVCFFMLNI